MKVDSNEIAVISILLILGILSCKKNSNPNKETDPKTDSTWNLVFKDDFSGSSLDTQSWSPYFSPGNAGNGLRRPEAFSVSDGNLIVTAQMINGILVSGGMANTKNYQYGKFEFRVRTEKDPREATSGVILTWPESERWPIDGENDMYETGTDSSRASFNTFIHYGTSPNTQYQFNQQADATEWHVVAMEWEKDYINMYRDSVLVWTLSDTTAIPHVPHHLCIQLDAFKTSMTGKVRMYVDWVKIYQLKK